VGTEHKRKPYIDVMENVFGGVQITTDKEPRARTTTPDLRGRPLIGDVNLSSVQVKTEEEDK